MPAKPLDAISLPVLLILNQMAGPMTRELVEDLADRFGPLELFTGHPDTLRTSTHPGVRLTRAPMYQRGGNFRRVWSWLCYLFAATIWLLRRPRGIPLLVFSNPPLAPWLAALNKVCRGTRFAVMVHDIYPDVLVRQGIVGESNWITRAWRWGNRWAYKWADIMMTLGPCMAKVLQQDALSSVQPTRKIEVVPPWADGQRLKPMPKSENPFVRQYGLEGSMTVMYSGNMGRGHDLESVLAAARLLETSGTGVKFMLIGAGPKWEWLRQQLATKPLATTTLLPWQDESRLREQLSAADMAVVSLEVELSGLAIPSKAYYFLAAEVPLIAICEAETELAALIRDFQCGIVVPPGTPEQLAAILRDVRDDPELLASWKQGARHAARCIDRSTQTKYLGDLLEQQLFEPRGQASKKAHSRATREPTVS